MSLMLDALKRIEAKQANVRVPQTAGQLASCTLPPTVVPAETIELPPTLLTDILPSIPADESPVPREPISLEETMDQLQAFVAEAGLLYDSTMAFDATEFPLEEQPAGTPQQTLPVEEEPAALVEEAPPMSMPVFLPETEPEGEPQISAALDTESENARFLATLLPEIESVVPAIEFVPESQPEAEVPVVMPVASDPYVAAAQQILQQLPRDRSQVVLFTSPADGHGKTMTLARLAPRLAESREGHLLVVDANFRNPDMARWLGVTPACRLPDVIAGAADWAAAAQTTSHERVSLLPGGTETPGWGAGRMIQGMSQLLRELAGHYDLVVVDASSLAHRGTVELAAVCDATYLVVRLGDASPRMVREAAQVVQLGGGRLLGCVAVDAG